MDEMNIISKFTTNVLSKIVESVVRKKTGYEMDFQLNELKTTIVDGKTHVHLDVDVELTKEEQLKILRNIGLN